MSQVPEQGESDRSVLDRLGIGVSMTCAVHCVLSSLLALAPALGLSGSGLAGGGMFGVGTAMEWLELPLLLSALGIGLFTLVPAYLRSHKKPLALALFALGMGLVFMSRLVVSPMETSPLETMLTVVGVIFIASAHVVNLRAHAVLHRDGRAHAH